jgi:hypothetical protein
LGINWDYRLNFLGQGIKLEPHGDLPAAFAGPYWKLVEAKWLNEEEAAGASQIFVKALDIFGNPLENAAFVVARPGAEDPVVTKGRIDDYWGNYTMYGMLGTYKVRMTEGGHPSEQVAGIGLGSEEVPNAWTNTAFRLTFQLVERERDTTVLGPEDEAPDSTGPEEQTSATPDEEGPETPPEPEPISLHQALVEATQAHLAARSPRGRYYRYARKHGLGRRQSQDFSFEHAGIKYTAQAFEKGIVYAPVGEWDEITHIENDA